jgi:capsular polysaccharide biosynthesis protein
VKTAADRAAAPVTPKISVPRRQFSFLSITELAIARWPSILLLTSVWMLGALVLSWGFCETRYTATVQLAREAATDFETQPPALTPRAFARLVRSQGVLERVSQRVAPALDAAALANNVKVATDSRNERVTLTVAGDSPDQAVALANLYARELLVAQRSAAAAAMTARPLATGAEPDNAGTPAEVLPGRYRVSAPAKEVVVHNRWLRIAGWTALGLLAGLIFSLPITIVSEFLDDRLKTAADVARVTGLPILGSMGNLFQMLPTERNTHGSRLWRALRIRLADAPENGALICGVASSGELEGKTTLIRLLGQTACQHGYRVKVIHLRPPRPGTRPSHTTVDESLTQVEELAAPNAIAHLKRAGCTLDQMVAFERALGELRKIPRLLVLVELPSAEIPEAVTAAEKLPNLLWVADCNRVHAASTKTQLESLRQAQCRIVGAVLNHEPQAFLRDRFPRWFSAS